VFYYSKNRFPKAKKEKDCRFSDVFVTAYDGCFSVTRCFLQSTSLLSPLYFRGALFFKTTALSTCNLATGSFYEELALNQGRKISAISRLFFLFYLDSSSVERFSAASAMPVRVL